jgi:hypothetical protein
MNEHIGDSAALYALGALEARERERIDAHVAHCESCLKDLGRAEQAVAALDDAMLPRIEPPAELGRRIAASAAVVRPAPAVRRPFVAPRWAMAMAAAFALATGLWGGVQFQQAAGVRAALRADDLMLATLVNSHFKHQPFTPRRAGAPNAKVLFAPDGAWFYVIVDGSAGTCRLLARSATGERDLGSPALRGGTATLMVRDFPRPTSLELVGQDGGTIAGVSLTY